MSPSTPDSRGNNPSGAPGPNGNDAMMISPPSKRPHEPESATGPLLSAAAARAEVKIRVQSDPALERHIQRLEDQNAQLQRNNAALQQALDVKSHENIQNFQAALA